MPPAQAGRSSASTREHLLGLLGPVVTGVGCDLEDVTVQAAGRRNLVRVIVDADGGVDLDTVAEVSRAVSSALDADGDDFAGPYVLEVSSPGVDRALTEPRHWRRAIGRLVTAQAAGKSITGRVMAAEGTGVRFDIDGTQREVGWAELGNGKVQVEFNHPDLVAPEDEIDTDEDGEG